MSKTKKVNIKVDRQKCIGCAMCVSLAPNTFEHDKQNIAVVKKGKHDPNNKITQAAENCPVGAISISK